MFKARVGQLSAAQHACYFFGALFVAELADVDARPAAGFLFFNEQMMVRKRRNLGQMSDAKNLIVGSQSLQFLANCLRCASADAGIDLIEDQGSLRS